MIFIPYCLIHLFLFIFIVYISAVSWKLSRYFINTYLCYSICWFNRLLFKWNKVIHFWMIAQYYYWLLSLLFIDFHSTSAVLNKSEVACHTILLISQSILMHTGCHSVFFLIHWPSVRIYCNIIFKQKVFSMYCQSFNSFS